MDEQIKAVEAVLAALRKEKTESPYMHVAIGGLTTAVDNLRSYAAKNAKAKKFAVDSTN